MRFKLSGAHSLFILIRVAPQIIPAPLGWESWRKHKYLCCSKDDRPVRNYFVEERRHRWALVGVRYDRNHQRHPTVVLEPKVKSGSAFSGFDWIPWTDMIDDEICNRLRLVDSGIGGIGYQLRALARSYQSASE